MKKRQTVRKDQKILCAANEILNRVLYIPEVLETIDEVSRCDEIFTALNMCVLKRWIDPDSYDYQSEYSYDFAPKVEKIRADLANDLFFGPNLTKLRLIISDYLKKFWGKQYFAIIDFLIMNRILTKVMQNLMEKNHRGHSYVKQTPIRKKFKAEAYKISFSLEFLIRFEERYNLLNNQFDFAVPESDYTEYKKLIGVKPKFKFKFDSADDGEYRDLEKLDNLLIERARRESLDPVLFLCLEELASSRNDLDSYTDEISAVVTKGGRIFWRNGDSVDLSQFNLKMYLLPFLFKNLDNLVFTSNVLDAYGGDEDDDEDFDDEDFDDDDEDFDDDDVESSIGEKGSQNSTKLSYCFEYAIGIRENHFLYMDEDPFTLRCYSEDWVVSRTIKIANANNKNSDVFLLTFWNDKIFIDRHVAGRSKHPDLLG